MDKKTNKYTLTLKLDQYANGNSEPAKVLELQFENHDELFEIIDRMKAKNLFATEEEATEFAIGLKLFSEVMLRNRKHPVFEDLQAGFSLFMKNLKKA
jgi:hypothetical protein